MTLELRIVLITVSILTTLLILHKIRQSKLQIEDSLFWIGFSAILLLFSIFPQLPAILAGLAGTYTTANFIYLSVIFLLIVKLFHITIKMSQLENRVKELVQEMALSENEREQGTLLAKTEIEETVAVKTEQVKTESVKAEQVKTELVKTEQVKTESLKAD